MKNFINRSIYYIFLLGGIPALDGATIRYWGTETFK